MGDEMSRDYSQYGEQPIIEALLDILGLLDATTHERRFVDVGAADGQTCSNTRFLLERGWGGLLIESDCMRLQAMCRYLCQYRKAKPVLARVSCEPGETLEEVVRAAGVAPGTVDYLSIDIDGMDYWVWRETEITPPLVVIEYNPNYGPQDVAVVPYDPNFRWQGDDYFGATARALWELGLSKGYRLASYTTCNLIFVEAAIRYSSDLKILTPDNIPQVQVNPRSSRRLTPLASRGR